MKQNPLSNFSLLGRAVLLTTLLGGFMATSAKASLIIDPATASDPDGSDGGTPTQLIDGSLDNNTTLNTDLGTPGTTVALPASFPDATISQTINGEYRVFGDSPTNPIVFTLNLDPTTGGNLTGYDISGVYVYNYGENFEGTYYNNRGLGTTTLKYSTDGGATYLTYGTLTFTEAAATASNPGEEITLGSTLSGVTNLEFSADTSLGGGYTSLNEVRFIGTAATPEPSTYGMVFVGLGVLALVSRRRRSGGLLL
jgi:hypothetical protein